MGLTIQLEGGGESGEGGDEGQYQKSYLHA